MCSDCQHLTRKAAILESNPEASGVSYFSTNDIISHQLNTPEVTHTHAALITPGVNVPLTADRDLLR